jgi:serine/threonine-protein kinase
MLRSIVRTSAVLSVLAAPRLAFGGDVAAAQSLFDQAKQLVAQGHYDQACPKLQESQRLDPGIGTQFHLADCLQHIGRNASAWSLFREVESQAHALGQQGRERVARDRATALEPFLSRLIIAPKDYGESAHVEVRRDGVPVARDEWSVPVPIDPGTHVVTLLAANKRPWESNVDVPADGRVVTVDLPAMADLPDVNAPPTARGATPPSPGHRQPERGVTQAMPPGQEEVVLQNRGGVQRAFGWFLIGGGAVSLGAATYFGSQWLEDHNKYRSHCHGTQCDSVGLAARNSARNESHDLETAAGLGGAALLVGTVIVLSAPRPRLVVNNAASIEVAPMAGSTKGIAVSGTW